MTETLDEFAYKNKLWLEIEDVREILDNLNFSKHSCIDMGWKYEVEVHSGFYFIRTSFQRKDINDGEFGTGWGRWNTAPISGATETSIVMTAWVCVEQVVKHELLEGFEYKGKKVLSPHKTIQQLVYPENLPNG
jgi:hypothetical protein